MCKKEKVSAKITATFWRTKAKGHVLPIDLKYSSTTSDPTTTYWDTCYGAKKNCAAVSKDFLYALQMLHQLSS